MYMDWEAKQDMLVVERTQEVNLNRVEWRKRIYIATLYIQDKGFVVVLLHNI